MAGNVDRVCIIGLDCAAPELVFDLWAERLPNLRRIMRTGIWGPLESTTPPITVPAWMAMMTGKDPGTLGIYGFRNRRDFSYDGLSFASSRLVQEPTLWDVLKQHGRRTIALGVPLTYPPRPILGLLVSDFLAPDTRSDYTYPPDLKHEIEATVGEYIFDTREFRTDNKDRLLSDIYDMTRQRFQLARHFVTTKPWDLFVMVEMGPDRIHHAFWKYFDEKHPKFEAGNPYQNAIRDYYVALDQEVGSLVELLPPNTRILVVSDHGAKRMDGGICINEWLIREGYLYLKDASAIAETSSPSSITKFSPSLVDWARTRAWGDGGYYGRLFLNVAGREPNGVVTSDEIESLKRELSYKLEALGDENGRPIGTRVFRPESIYAACRNVAPDLIVYFGDLNWRSVGSIGHDTVWTHTNDIGPDDANHAQHGIFLMTDNESVTAQEFGVSGDENAPEYPAEGNQPANSNRYLERMSPVSGRREDLSIYDVAPTVLQALGITPPPGMGRSVVGAATGPGRSEAAYSPEEEEELARRLEDLGYL